MGDVYHCRRVCRLMWYSWREVFSWRTAQFDTSSCRYAYLSRFSFHLGTHRRPWAVRMTVSCRYLLYSRLQTASTRRLSPVFWAGVPWPRNPRHTLSRPVSNDILPFCRKRPVSSRSRYRTRTYSCGTCAMKTTVRHKHLNEECFEIQLAYDSSNAVREVVDT